MQCMLPCAAVKACLSPASPPLIPCPSLDRGAFCRRTTHSTTIKAPAAPIHLPRRALSCCSSRRRVSRPAYQSSRRAPSHNQRRARFNYPPAPSNEPLASTDKTSSTSAAVPAADLAKDIKSLASPAHRLRAYGPPFTTTLRALRTLSAGLGTSHRDPRAWLQTQSSHCTD
ncbi:hypothetical protein K491DRAFT_178188 [Lophiostoma macrostomum CBS 122681]|uniref:Uncharacterized protein n=1 Tax=Lophiostoma macrostomum CBS 122681 TaxID=1314788 RepID=A0A6A6TU37_9PLEO|nr:hypothetical protein K491DRAFT_178188 [Lophiostoma macrostomum CBS 122681]